MHRLRGHRIPARVLGAAGALCGSAVSFKHLRNSDRARIDLTIMSSAPILFPDFRYHGICDRASPDRSSLRVKSDLREVVMAASVAQTAAVIQAC